MEVSYGHEIIGLEGADTIYKDNVGAKLLVIEQGNVVPAVSIGGVWKHTTFDGPDGTDDLGLDLYLVATKLIKELPRPVPLSGGLISTTAGPSASSDLTRTEPRRSSATSMCSRWTTWPWVRVQAGHALR